MEWSKLNGGRRTRARSHAWPKPVALPTRALADVLASTGLEGRTEAQVRNRWRYACASSGASGPSYETIVATGPTNAARPHHRPTDTLIEAGHTVIIDVGALYDGYHSDMTRTFFIGEPTPLQQELYEVVLDAQKAGVAAVESGLSTAELDAVCRDRHRSGWIRRVVQPRHRPRRRLADPRGSVHQSHR